MNKIKVIGFDADDTLWVNEPYYQEVEKIFCNLLATYLPEKEISGELFKTEIANLEKYGYGAKGFILSMIETALKISNNKVSSETIYKLLKLGKELLEKPIELLDDIEFSLNQGFLDFQSHFFLHFNQNILHCFELQYRILV